MTRISKLFVAYTTLAMLALFVGIAGAAQIGSLTNAQVHNPVAAGAPAKPPTNQPTGQKTISWKPKAINNSGAGK